MWSPMAFVLLLPGLLRHVRAIKAIDVCASTTCVINDTWNSSRDAAILNFPCFDRDANGVVRCYPYNSDLTCTPRTNCALDPITTSPPASSTASPPSSSDGGISDETIIIAAGCILVVLFTLYCISRCLINAFHKNLADDDTHNDGGGDADNTDHYSFSSSSESSYIEQAIPVVHVVSSSFPEATLHEGETEMGHIPFATPLRRIS
ncbi:Aste57867_9519 [Aphanomyces stellatus]|uniref:Aste57867_9519 protein n=1 Tax=Aphanomyces stellatus TaxID=120398 RepID=A0A485KND4_9STRA|nr:hypothetical protein As57867_009482 [Aphanomyces stellatus]VFT86398.1 Aste57867_9519 [Aphanomyces stellatus]